MGKGSRKSSKGPLNQSASEASPLQPPCPSQPTRDFDLLGLEPVSDTDPDLIVMMNTKASENSSFKGSAKYSSVKCPNDETTSLSKRNKKKSPEPPTDKQHLFQQRIYKKKILDATEIIRFQTYEPKQSSTNNNFIRRRIITKNLDPHATRDRYVRGNFRCFVRDPVAYLSLMHDPDSTPDWSCISVVEYINHDNDFTCSICLEKDFVAPRITPCGHIFCFPCILHYLTIDHSIDSLRTSVPGLETTDDQMKQKGLLSLKNLLSSNLSKRCPLCFDIFCKNELRPVRIQKVRNPVVGLYQSFVLIERKFDEMALRIPSTSLLPPSVGLISRPPVQRSLGDLQELPRAESDSTFANSSFPPGLTAETPSPLNEKSTWAKEGDMVGGMENSKKEERKRVQKKEQPKAGDVIGEKYYFPPENTIGCQFNRMCLLSNYGYYELWRRDLIQLEKRLLESVEMGDNETELYAQCCIDLLHKERALNPFHIEHGAAYKKTLPVTMDGNYVAVLEETNTFGKYYADEPASRLIRSYSSVETNNHILYDDHALTRHIESVSGVYKLLGVAQDVDANACTAVKKYLEDTATSSCAPPLLIRDACSPSKNMTCSFSSRASMTLQTSPRLQIGNSSLLQGSGSFGSAKNGTAPVSRRGSANQENVVSPTPHVPSPLVTSPLLSSSPHLPKHSGQVSPKSSHYSYVSDNGERRSFPKKSSMQDRKSTNNESNFLDGNDKELKTSLKKLANFNSRNYIENIYGSEFSDYSSDSSNNSFYLNSSSSNYSHKKSNCAFDKEIVIVGDEIVAIIEGRPEETGKTEANLEECSGIAAATLRGKSSIRKMEGRDGKSIPGMLTGGQGAIQAQVERVKPCKLIPEIPKKGSETISPSPLLATLFSTISQGNKVGTTIDAASDVATKASPIPPLTETAYESPSTYPESSKKTFAKGDGSGTLEKEETAAPEDAYYFYQDPNGQFVYLHPFIQRCLLYEYNNNKKLLPRTLENLLIDEVETIEITREIRKRYKYLSHLPLNTSIIFASADIRNLLSPKTMEQFGETLNKRVEQLKEKEKKRKKQEEINKKKYERMEVSNQMTMLSQLTEFSNETSSYVTTTANNFQAHFPLLSFPSIGVSHEDVTPKTNTGESRGKEGGGDSSVKKRSGRKNAAKDGGRDRDLVERTETSKSPHRNASCTPTGKKQASMKKDKKKLQRERKFIPGDVQEDTTTPMSDLQHQMLIEKLFTTDINKLSKKEKRILREQEEAFSQFNKVPLNDSSSIVLPQYDNVEIDAKESGREVFTGTAIGLVENMKTTKGSEGLSIDAIESSITDKDAVDENSYVSKLKKKTPVSIFEASSGPFMGSNVDGQFNIASFIKTKKKKK